MTLPRGVGVGAGGGADGRAGGASFVRALRSESDARALLSLESLRPVCVGDGVARGVESVLFFGREVSAFAGTPLSEMTVGSFGAFVVELLDTQGQTIPPFGPMGASGQVLPGPRGRVTRHRSKI